MKFEKFKATFQNFFKLEKQLAIPTEQEIKSELITFAWTPFEEAVKEAGPLTKSILLEMQPLLKYKKRFIFVDSKIQYFDPDDSPIDSLHWHVDGSPSVENEMSKKLGHILLHDMYARMTHKDPPTFLAFQSWDGCATEFLNSPLELEIPKCIPSFSVIDDEVEKLKPTSVNHSPGSIVSFNGWSLHRAIRANKKGWRLWIRVKETDHFTAQSSIAPHFFGTTFK